MMRQDRFTEGAQEVLAASQEMVRKERHSQWDVEHVLLSLLTHERGVMPQLWEKLKIDRNALLGAVNQTLDKSPKLSYDVVQIYTTPRIVKMLEEANAEGVDVDASYRDETGRLVNRRRQFGNMVLARWPILMVRNHLLPKLHLRNPLSLQRSALETIVALPDGPCRVVSVHLAHAATSERLTQIERLLAILKAAPGDGGAWSGTDFDAGWGLDAPPIPQPSRTIAMGDFNCEPNSEEYALLCGSVVSKTVRSSGPTSADVTASGSPDDETMLYSAGAPAIAGTGPSNSTRT